MSGVNSRRCLTIILVVDAVAEDTESFIVVLTSANVRVIIETPDITITITDTSSEWGSLTQLQSLISPIITGVLIGFEYEDYTVSEGDSQVVVCVELMSGTLNREAMVDLSTQPYSPISADDPSTRYT